MGTCWNGNRVILCCIVSNKTVRSVLNLETGCVLPPVHVPILIHSHTHTHTQTDQTVLDLHFADIHSTIISRYLCIWFYVKDFLFLSATTYTSMYYFFVFNKGKGSFQRLLRYINQNEVGTIARNIKVFFLFYVLRIYTYTKNKNYYKLQVLFRCH